jgi:hypothetical protein
MIVSFTTTMGTRYHIDHANKQFVQETPKHRAGPLFNTPTVKIGKRVEIWTADTDSKIRVISTAPVKLREVTLEQPVQQP